VTEQTNSVTEAVNGVAAAIENEGEDLAWAYSDNGGVMAVFGRGEVGMASMVLDGVPSLVIWPRSAVADPDGDDAPLRAIEAGQCVVLVFEKVDGAMGMAKQLASLMAEFVPKGERRDKARTLADAMPESIDEAVAQLVAKAKGE
jgi:hypothetical protein